MSPKTHYIFNPFFGAYYKINVDLFAEKWIFYSNFILQENTAKAKILEKIKRNQPTTGLRSQLKIKVATGSVVASQFQVTTSPNSALKKK